jgi:hypothetical protein
MRALFFVLVLPVCVTSFATEPSEGFQPLFDGKSLAGWVNKTDDGQPNAESQWSVKEGVLSATPGNGWLSTEKMYGDFVLRLEWRVPENGNSGVFIRVPELKSGQRPHEQGIEIQVLDDKGLQYAGKLKPYQYAGSIYGAVPAENSGYKGAGEWNQFEITCRGPKIEVTMNGNKAASADPSQLAELRNRPLRGYIGLQNHGSSIEYRKIEIKELE